MKYQPCFRLALSLKQSFRGTGTDQPDPPCIDASWMPGHSTFAMSWIQYTFDLNVCLISLSRVTCCLPRHSPQGQPQSYKYAPPLSPNGLGIGAVLVAAVSASRPGLYSLVPSPRNIHACRHNFKMGLGGRRKGNVGGDCEEAYCGTA